MDVRAAVAIQAGKPLEIMTVQLEGPKAGEVLSRSRPPASATPGADQIGGADNTFDCTGNTKVMRQAISTVLHEA
jgi:Zn-dependent alcohol dehydrogenase